MEEAVSTPVEQYPASRIRLCCQQTIAKHAANNPMMVCQDCKHLIKCFRGEAAYRNYITFCNSRKRKIMTGTMEGYLVVVFRSYDPYS